MSEAFEQARQLMNDDHPEIKRRKRLLTKIRDKKLLAADTRRKNAIKNINDMYNYEIEEANSLFEKDCVEIQCQLYNEISKDIKFKNKVAANNDDSKVDTAKARNTRSSGGSMEKMEFLSLQPRDRISRKRNIVLEKEISESMIRSDFLAIVEDIEQQSAARQQYLSSLKPINHVTVNDDVLSVNGSEYIVGSHVAVFSVVSGEYLHGVVTDIASDRVVVKCGTSQDAIISRVGFQVSHIQSGRVIINVSTEFEENASIIQEAASMKGNSSSYSNCLGLAVCPDLK